MPKSPVSNKTSRLALLLGLGALSAAGASGSTAMPATAGAQPSDLVIRCENGLIFCAENGGEFRPLRLADTAEASRLRTLLQANGDKVEIRIPATILAGDGGDGFHWAPPRQRPVKTNAAARSRGQTAPQPAQPDPMPADRKTKG